MKRWVKLSARNVFTNKRTEPLGVNIPDVNGITRRVWDGIRHLQNTCVRRTPIFSLMEQDVIESLPTVEMFSDFLKMKMKIYVVGKKAKSAVRLQWLNIRPS